MHTCNDASSAGIFVVRPVAAAPRSLLRATNGQPPAVPGRRPPGCRRRPPCAQAPQNRRVKLLCLIRFQPLGDDLLTAWEAVELFAAALPDAGGIELHREDLEALLLFQDPGKCLQLLSDTLDAGEKDGFLVSAGLAQGIQSNAAVASSLAGFTENSIETLYDVAANAGPQEVAISARLSSILNLAAPFFSDRFVPAVALPDSRIRAPLVMRPTSQPVSLAERRLRTRAAGPDHRD